MNAERNTMVALKLGRLMRDAEDEATNPPWMTHGQEELLNACRSQRDERVISKLQPILRDRKMKTLLAAALVCGLSAAAFLLVSEASLSSAPRAITFNVDGEKALSDGKIAATDRPKFIHFSDGSALSLAPGASARVQRTDENGATVVMEGGTLESSIAHKDDTRWSVLLGQYEVKVIGTRFTSTLDPKTSKVTVELHEGAVQILGHGISEVVELKAGQRFDANAEGGWNVSAGMNDREVQTDKAASAADLPITDEPIADAPEEPNHDKATVFRGPQISWNTLIAQGKFDAVLTAAKARGLDSCLRSCATSDLRALSDAARYKGNTDLAQNALLRLREVAPGERARAGYLLGSLAEAGGQTASALSWYGRYVSEAPGGPLNSEARAGSMRCLVELGRKSEAKKAAIQYLDMYPQGVGAKVARRILSKP
jgi:ferric-dicitrate binding protein FerR (iron transport regulator)